MRGWAGEFAGEFRRLFFTFPRVSLRPWAGYTRRVPRAARSWGAKRWHVVRSARGRARGLAELIQEVIEVGEATADLRREVQLLLGLRCLRGGRGVAATRGTTS